MILAFRVRHANDNYETQNWVCHACQNGAFLLEFENERTHIRCAVCRIDVTSHITPSLEQPHARS